MSDSATLNRAALAILAPLLVTSGIVGLIAPDYQSTSHAPAYQAFHIVCGTAGLLLVLSNDAARIRGFNIGFGLIDAYQAMASALHLFPERLFRWTRTDDVLHVAIGAGLLLIGFSRARSR